MPRVSFCAADTGGSDGNGSELSGELKIFRAALMMAGSSDTIRIESALELLKSSDENARRILLEVLEQDEVPAAKQAVCRALSQARGQRSDIKDVEDFIKPLITILSKGNAENGRLAAEAMLIFEYRQIANPLRHLIDDNRLSTEARINGLYAMQLRPTKEAIFELIKLLDDDNEIIASAAAEGLQESIGIPVNTSKQEWKRIAKELQRKSGEEFVKDRLILQEAKVRLLEGEIQYWKKIYETSLDQIYRGAVDDQSRGDFLALQLTSDRSSIRLWALEKVLQWRKSGTQLPEKLGQSLLGLISDGDREVRLKTAKVLSLVSNLDSSEKLLRQLSAEKDADIQTELLGALGEACYYALSPGSNIKLGEQTRVKTLELAGKYVQDSNSVKVKKGAEVIRKLLEQPGLQPDKAQQYLSVLAKRYELAKTDANDPLVGELLNVMSGLCRTGFYYRMESSRLFEKFFTESLDSENYLVREACVNGLINIDEPRALAVLAHQKDFFDDGSLAIRKTLTELAGRVGDEEDLEWLNNKLTNNGESEAAWQAMSKIFQRCDVAILNEWIDRFGSEGIWDKMSFEQQKFMLENLEKKAFLANEASILQYARFRLASIYKDKGQPEQAAKYYGMLLEEMPKGTERDNIIGLLIDVELKSEQFGSVSQIAANRLLENDLDSNDAVVYTISKYLATAGDKAKQRKLLSFLSQIKYQQGRPLWDARLKEWSQKMDLKEPDNASSNGGAK